MELGRGCPANAVGGASQILKLDSSQLRIYDQFGKLSCLHLCKQLSLVIHHQPFTLVKDAFIIAIHARYVISGPPSPVSFSVTSTMPQNSTLHHRHHAFEVVSTAITLACLDASPTSVPLQLAFNSINLDESNSKLAVKRSCRRDEVSGSKVMIVVVTLLHVPLSPPWSLMEMIAIDLAMLLTLSPPGEGNTAKGNGGGEWREKLHQQIMIGGQLCSHKCLKVVKT